MFLQYFYKKENKEKNYSDNIYIKIIRQSIDILNNNDCFTWMETVLNSKYEVNMPVLEYSQIYMDAQTRDALKANAYNIINYLYYDFALETLIHVD